ncbi:hypothetical protein GOODEAATRI_014456 [Goodea atripinnis]|uniref:Secreted protein n=1 Tax=Goodea atripinnis TaxID=208336 RepID=A0ABV0PP18_9TELE
MHNYGLSMLLCLSGCSDECEPSCAGVKSPCWAQMACLSLGSSPFGPLSLTKVTFCDHRMSNLPTLHKKITDCLQNKKNCLANQYRNILIHCEFQGRSPFTKIFSAVALVYH